MNDLKAKPMVKLSGTNKIYTLSGRGGIRLTSDDDIHYTSDEALLVFKESIKCGCAEQITYSVKNTSSDTVKIDHISSGCFDSIGGGLLPWYDDRKFKLQICYFTWQGEAQWREVTLSDMGLFKASNHEDVNAIRLRSVGNQSTAMYYPQIIIEDTELNKTYFFEIETTGNWYIEISGKANGNLCVELNSAFFNNDNWFLNLQSGKEYMASPCIYGVVDGGFEEAVAAMTDYRRSVSKADFDTVPVCFNDYMNCLWGMPTAEKLIPLIDKTAEIGCELFCIDAGWQKSITKNERDLGNWQWQDERFPGYGFKGIIEYINSKGMIPGVWLELNSVANASILYNQYNQFLLRRNGEYAGASGNFQIDFREEPVIEFMTEVIDRLYGAGVRYIKNDYNQTSGIGFDGALCGGEEVRVQSLAFIDFIDMIKEKYPDLIIENCASGSMRTDGSMMKHFELVSVSDQEYYYDNPSILAGMQACVQPEKCGSWAYPYPQFFDDRLKPAAECVNTNSDDNINETIFNMVNGMMGLMYMSGHIELADAVNTELMKEAIKVYKENRAFIKSAYPIYPSGRFGIEKKGFYAYGLRGKAENKILLAVWRIGSLEDVGVFDISKYVNANSTVKPVYPQSVDTEFSYSNGKLSVKLNEAYTARLFEISNNRD